MRVKINGKEVEVGPSRTHKENCGCLGKLSQKITQNSNDYSGLIVNGNKVDMNNPDDIQRALQLCRKIGRIFLGVIILVLLTAVNEIDWANFDYTEDFIGGIFMLFVWFVIAFVVAFLVPRSLQKRLDELKKQGKLPSKYGNKLNTSQNSLNQKADILKTNYPKLIVNGQEVNLDDPRIVEKLASIIQKISFGIMLIGFAFAAFDISLAISLILMGLVCRIYFLKIVHKYLNELKKQGKFPSKH